MKGRGDRREEEREKGRGRERGARREGEKGLFCEVWMDVRREGGRERELG